MKNRAQGTTEYLIFSGALILFLYGFFISGLPMIGPSCGCKRYSGITCVEYKMCLSAPPLTTALMSILRRPSELVADQVLDTTRLDIYGPWPPPPGPWGNPPDWKGMLPGTTPNDAGWIDNEATGAGPCPLARDTCDTEELPHAMPTGAYQGCIPGRDYDCHVVRCGYASPPNTYVEFDKHCRTADNVIDTCDGDAYSPYTCQPNDDKPSCYDWEAELACIGTIMAPGGCAWGVFGNAHRRTITCSPICCPS